MNNNRKIYFNIDSGASAHQIFALFDTVQRDNEDEVDEMINDSDNEFLAPEQLKLANNQHNASVLTPEANVHVVDKWITYTKERENNKKTKKPKIIYQSQENATFLHILERIVFLRVEFTTNLTRVLQLLISMNKLLMLTF